MKLGWWRARNKRDHKVDIKRDGGEWPWKSSTSDMCWRNDGSWNRSGMELEHDLIEFLRPLEDLPPALNSAVKAAEDRVRAWKTHHVAAQKLADDALFILEEAKRELERLEKECEVKS